MCAAPHVARGVCVCVCVRFSSFCERAEIAVGAFRVGVLCLVHLGARWFVFIGKL